MSVIVYKIEETKVTIEEVVALLHDAFKERKEQSLYFYCVNISVQEFVKFAKNATVFVALDESADFKLVGTASLIIKEGKIGNHIFKYAHILHAGVLSSEKRKGISKLMDTARMEYAKTAGCHYLSCDTAVAATSSVKRLLKFGYKVVKFTHHQRTNYYSYVFRYWLEPRYFEENEAFIIFSYLISAIKTKLIYRADGEYTSFAKLLGKNA